MKDIVIKISSILLLIVTILAILLKFYRIIDDYRYNELIKRREITGVTVFDPDQVLCGVFENCDYDTLQLTDNFKKKYPNRESIIKGIGKYDFFGSGYDHGNIFISADKLDIFGMVKNEYDNLYYFEYEVKDNLLDDVKLIRREVYDPINNVVIESEDY